MSGEGKPNKKESRYVMHMYLLTKMIANFMHSKHVLKKKSSRFSKLKASTAGLDQYDKTWPCRYTQRARLPFEQLKW